MAKAHEKSAALLAQDDAIRIKPYPFIIGYPMQSVKKGRRSDGQVHNGEMRLVRRGNLRG